LNLKMSHPVSPDMNNAFDESGYPINMDTAFDASREEEDVNAAVGAAPAGPEPSLAEMAAQLETEQKTGGSASSSSNGTNSRPTSARKFNENSAFDRALKAEQEKKAAESPGAED